MTPARALAHAAFVVLTGLAATATSLPAAAAPKRPAAAPPSPSSQSTSAAASDEPKSLSDVLSGDAKTQYDIARILYRDGDHAGALAKFRRAYDLSLDARLLWNMAACEKNLRHYVRVLGLVDQYVKDGRLGTEDLDRAKTFDTAVHAFVGDVTVRTNEAGAALSVDDEPIGTTPLDAPVPLDMGKRKVRLVKPGFRPVERTIEVEGGAKQELQLALDPEVGHIVVRARANDTIRIDDKAVGQGSWSGALGVGPHAVVVSTSSGKSRRMDLVLADRETRELTIEIEGDGGGLPKWVWWVGGGVLVAGAAVGGYFLFRPSAADPPSGTLGAYQVPK